MDARRRHPARLLPPLSVHWLRAEYDAQNQPISWTHIIASQGIGGASIKGCRFRMICPAKHRSRARPRFGSRDLLALRLQYAKCVVNECFIDEMAEASGQDPYEFRLNLLPEGSSMRNVLQLGAEKSVGARRSGGLGRGISCHNTWGVTDVAQVPKSRWKMVRCACIRVSVQ